MNNIRIEFPAYNIFYRQGGMWKLHGEPVIGKPYIEVESIAVGILFGKTLTDAVRVYGIFNCQQTFIKELSKKDFQDEKKGKETGEDILRKAMNAAIAICDNALKRGMYDELSTSTDFEMIRKILLESL